jgi:hypothetical protein
MKMGLSVGADRGKAVLRVATSLNPGCRRSEIGSDIEGTFMGILGPGPPRNQGAEYSSRLMNS